MVGIENLTKNLLILNKKCGTMRGEEEEELTWI